MKKAVKVKPCCLICQHCVEIFETWGGRCGLGHIIEGFVWDHVCKDFKLFGDLEPEEGEE